MNTLGRLEPVSIKTQWATEAGHFTPWLAESENLQLLSDTIGVPLTLERTERFVGPYRADIVCVEGGTSGEERRVVIENQFGRSDHDHLGKLVTYMAGTDAYTGILIAEEITDEHRAALEWLNEHSEPTKAFWGLQMELWRIGTSLLAPRFNVVVAPNPVTKLQHEVLASLSDVQRDRLEFWEGFHQYVGDAGNGLKVSKPRPETWVTHSIGRAGVAFSLVYSNYDLAEQHFIQDVVTRVELILTGPTAFPCYELLLSERPDIDAAMGDLPVTWYDRAAKERKVFVQRLWADDGSDHTTKYVWLLGELGRMKDVFAHRVLNFTPLPPE